MNMIHQLKRVPLSEGKKNYYMLGRTQPTQKGRALKQIKRYEFFSTPIEAKELITYSNILDNNKYYIPSTVLYIFDKNFLAKEFHDTIAGLGDIRFPTFEFLYYRFNKNQIILKLKQDIVQRENMQMFVNSFDNIIEYSKFLKSNIFIIQKFYYNDTTKNLTLIGAFLPVFISFEDKYTQQYLSALSSSWIEEE